MLYEWFSVVFFQIEMWSMRRTILHKLYFAKSLPDQTWQFRNGWDNVQSKSDTCESATINDYRDAWTEAEWSTSKSKSSFNTRSILITLNNLLIPENTYRLVMILRPSQKMKSYAVVRP